jgi:adenylate kinase
VEGGNLDYLDWVRSAARAGSGGAGDKSAPPFATREEVTEALSAPPARSGERGAAMAAAGAVPVAKAAGSGGLAPSESFKKLLTSMPPPAAEVHERVGNLKIALLGPPGVGKGTQAKLLSARYGLKHVSVGDIILKAVRGGTAFGQRAREFTQSGKLVPDEEVVALVRQYLSALGGGGCVLDGFPRTLAQAQALADDQPDFVFYLNAPQEVLIDRLTKRNYCDCGAAYGPGRAPLRAGVCDECGGKLYQREDDQPRHVLTRLDEYNSKTRELLRFYRDRLRPVDGSLSPGEVFKQVCKLLEKTP